METGPSWSCSEAVSKRVWHTPFLRVHWKTRDDGQGNCPKHVEFYSKIKFEKLVHLVGCIIRTYRVLTHLHSSIHSAARLKTSPQPLRKPVLHTVRSSASFSFHYPLVSLRSSSSCLRLLPLLPVTSSFYLSFNKVF